MVAGLTDLDGGLLALSGVGEARASTVLAAVEMARRMAESEMPRHAPMDRPDAIVGIRTPPINAPG